MKYTDSYLNDIDKVCNSIPKIENLRKKKIMITGATGLIGSSVADVLLRLNHKEHYEMTLYMAGRSEKRTFDRFTEYIPEKDYCFVRYDATKENFLNISPDYIIHCASNSSPKAYAEQPVETMLANLVGLNSLLDLSKKCNCKRLLYVSSSEVYGIKSDMKPFQEEDYGYVDILKSRSCYPSAKRAAETLCVSYSEEYGIDVVIVRPGHIYGAAITDNDDRASAQFTRKASRHEPIVLKSYGEQKRSYCYALDCASAMLACLINGNNRVAYNISNPDSIISIREIAELFAQCSETKLIFDIPNHSDENRDNPMNNSSLTSDRILELGWKACFDPIAGVKATLYNY